jgi:hypothetical protein
MMTLFRQGKQYLLSWSPNQDLIQTENAKFVDLESESRPHSDRKRKIC